MGRERWGALFFAWILLVGALGFAGEKPTASQLQAFAELRRKVEANIGVDLDAMATITGITADPDLQKIRDTLKISLDSLELQFQDGKINPFIGNFISEGQRRFVKVSASGQEHSRPLRIGYFPVAADPFHWAHLFTALEAMAQLGLDKVVFIVAGSDPRKPDLTPAELRHPLAKQMLENFSEFFAYSDITLQENANNPETPGVLSSNGANDGESNIFHDLARNSHLAIRAFYLVGSDHFNWTVEKKGKIQDDTVKKIEENMKKINLGFAAASGKHQLVAAFIARNKAEITDEKIAELRSKITYDLQVMVPTLSYSSTQIRNYFQGKSLDDKRPLIYLPTGSYNFILKHGLYAAKAQ